MRRVVILATYAILLMSAGAPRDGLLALQVFVERAEENDQRLPYGHPEHALLAIQIRVPPGGRVQRRGSGRLPRPLPTKGRETVAQYRKEEPIPTLL